MGWGRGARSGSRRRRRFPGRRSRACRTGWRPPVLAKPAEGALDGVALLVGDGVERGRPPAPAAAPEAVADLVGGFGDGGLDAASPQVSAGRPAGVGLVGQDLAGPGPGPARAPARDVEPVHQGGEGEGVVALPGAGDPGQRPAAGIGEQVDLGGQPAPGPAQRLPFLAGPGRVRPGGRRVLVIRWSPLSGPGRSAASPPAAAAQCPPAAHAAPRRRAGAPARPSHPPRPSTPCPPPHHTRRAAGPGSSPRSRPLTSGDARL